jgi:hypothetical protein
MLRDPIAMKKSQMIQINVDAAAKARELRKASLDAFYKSLEETAEPTEEEKEGRIQRKEREKQSSW